MDPVTLEPSRRIKEKITADWNSTYICPYASLGQLHTNYKQDGGIGQNAELCLIIIFSNI